MKNPNAIYLTYQQRRQLLFLAVPGYGPLDGQARYDLDRSLDRKYVTLQTLFAIVGDHRPDLTPEEAEFAVCWELGL